jgi:hypothetical protein
MRDEVCMCDFSPFEMALPDCREMKDILHTQGDRGFYKEEMSRDGRSDDRDNLGPVE